MRKDPNGPPTPQQLERAARVGIEVPPDITTWQLGRMIDEAPPTAAMLELAAQLGINADGMTASTLGMELTRTTRAMSLRVIRTNPAVKVNAYICFEGEVYLITAIHPANQRPSVTIQPAAGGKKRVVQAYRLRDAVAVEATPIRRAVGGRRG